MSNPIGDYFATAYEKAMAFAQMVESLEITQQALDTGRQLYTTMHDTMNATTQLGIIAGEEVEKLTNEYLPLNVASVVQRVFNGFAVTLALEVLPASATQTSLIIYGFAQCFIDVSPRIRNNVSNGIGVSLAIGAIKDLADFAITRNPCSVLSAVINLVCASAILSYEDEPNSPNNNNAFMNNEGGYVSDTQTEYNNESSSPEES